MTVRFTCLIEQLVNLLAALANEPELLSTNEIQVTGGPDKNKTIQVRLTRFGTARPSPFSPGSRSRTASTHRESDSLTL